MTYILKYCEYIFDNFMYVYCLIHPVIELSTIKTTPLLNIRTVS